MEALNPHRDRRARLHRVSLMLVCMGALWGAAFPALSRADEFTRVQNYSAELSSRGLFVIDTRIGDIRIEGWDEPRVAIEAEKVVQAGSQAKAERLFPQIKILLSEESEGLLLRTVYPRRTVLRPFRGATKLSANFRIRVPAEVNLRLKCVDGDVTVRGLRGHEQIRVGYGNVEVSVPSLERLRSLKANAFLGYVQSDLHGEDSAGFGRKVSFWNPDGEQNVAVSVRLGGVYIYHVE